MAATPPSREAVPTQGPESWPIAKLPLALLAGLVPIVGAILYYVWRSKHPEAARFANRASLIGFFGAFAIGIALGLVIRLLDSGEDNVSRAKASPKTESTATGASEEQPAAKASKPVAKAKEPVKVTEQAPPSLEELAKQPLYKDYLYLTPREEIEKRHPEGEDCSSPGVIEAWCVEGMSFLGMEWTGVLVFQDAKLTRVALATENSDDKHGPIMAALGKDFIAISAVSGSEQLDVAALLAKHGDNRDRINTEIQGFDVRSRERGSFAMAMIAMDAAIPLLKSERTATAIMQKLPFATRVIGYELLEEDEDGHMLRIVFELPKADALRHQLAAASKAETF